MRTSFFRLKLPVLFSFRPEEKTLHLVLVSGQEGEGPRAGGRQGLRRQSTKEGGADSRSESSPVTWWLRLGVTCPVPQPAHL